MIFFKLSLLLLILLSYFSCLHVSAQNPCLAERQKPVSEILFSCLLKQYSSLAKPPGLKLKSRLFELVIHRVDTINHKVDVSIQLDFFWYDSRLSWNSSSYSGLDFSSLPINRIWTPTISIPSSKPYLEPAMVFSDGSVFSLSLDSFPIYCQFTLSNFPYDEVECGLVVWLQNVIEKEFEEESAFPCQHCFYSTDPEWTPEVSSSKGELTKPTTSFYSKWTYNFKLRRNYQLYNNLLVLPNLIWVAMTLALPWMPHSSKQRLYTMLILIFALLILSQMTSRVLPNSYLTPTKIHSNFLACFLLLLFTFICSIVTCNLHSRNPALYSMHPLVKKIFFHPFVTMITLVNTEQSGPSVEECISRLGVGEVEARSPLEKVNCRLQKLMDISVVTKSLQGDNQWKQLAMIIDRLFFYTFVFIHLLVTMVLYLAKFEHRKFIFA